MKRSTGLKLLLYLLLSLGLAGCSGDSPLQNLSVEVSASSNVSGLMVTVQADGVSENFTIGEAGRWHRDYKGVQIMTIAASGYSVDDKDGTITIKIKDRDNPERVARGVGKDIRCSLTYP